MWLKLCVLALCGICSTQSVQLSPSQSIFSLALGSALEVNCTISAGTVKWMAGDSENLGSRVQIRGSVNTGGENVSTLTISNVTSDEAKTYRCKKVGGEPSDPSEPSEVSFELKIFSVTTQNAEFEHNKDAVLICQVTDTSRTYSYSWKKGDVAVDQITVEGKQAFNDFNNGTLEIKHALRSFAGKYTCIAKYSESSRFHTIEHDVYYYATPKVIPFEKSKNLMEKERLTIECRVLGYPKPNVTWWKGGNKIKRGEKSRYVLSPADTYNEMTMEDAKLEIESVEFADGGEYTCMSENDMWPGYNSTQVILVRVKDQYAALWPFLGILAEVIILCTIIFIYEKKRNKETTEEEVGNQDGGAPEKQTEGVRHRGTNNPRA